MSTSNVLLPTSILVGCSLIAVALVVALKSGAPQPDAPSQPAVATPAPAPVVAPTPVEPPAPVEPPTPSPTVVAKAHENIARALAAERARLVAACWTPPDAKKGEPSRITLTFNFSVGADGRVLGWGIAEHREAHRSAVADCLRTQKLEALKIAAPGAPLLVETTIYFP